LHKNIKNLIFDLGGVILNIDYNKTVESFSFLGVKNFEQLYSQANQNNLFDLLETGKITPQDFRNQIRKISKLNLTDLQIDTAWCAMLLDLPEERINFLLEIKKKYNIFLLSNTNQIHIEKFTENLHIQFNENIFDRVFEKVYYSSQIGVRKPDVAAFHCVLKEYKLNPQETFFIDDSMQHVRGAIQAGISADLLLKDASILDYFKDWM
jgi:glucose-1-phosphatase